jgi:hypothetical protein
MSGKNFVGQLKTSVWVQHYWFVALTVCLSYPVNPNDNIKKQYYELYQNIFLYLPSNDDIRPYYSYIERFPITPYLDSRESLLQWLFFIRHQITDSLGIDRQSRQSLMKDYYDQYISKPTRDFEKHVMKKCLIGASMITALVATIWWI